MSWLNSQERIGRYEYYDGRGDLSRHYADKYLCQTTLGIAPIPVMTSPVLRFSAQNQAVLNTQTPMPASGASTVDSAYIEQIRFLIMGMEEHLIQREAKLKATVARAEKEIKRADDMKNEILSQ